jgi:creatinine amidohydrolase
VVNADKSDSNGRRPYVYGDLTWPELDESSKRAPVVVLPIGSMEQHGPHLPLDSDIYPMTRWCLDAATRAPDDILLMETIPYGYNIHATDFPGTIHIEHDTFINYCTDVCRSVAHHGFKKIVLVNGHGSNAPALDFVARRVVMETDALCASLLWLSLGADDFKPVRESVFPGGCSHACEAETSAYLYVNPGKVQMDKAQDHVRTNMDDFFYVDLFGAGPVKYGYWTSADSPHGAIGQPTLANAEKGRVLYESSLTRFVEFVRRFRQMPLAVRTDHHSTPPSERRVESFAASFPEAR